MAKPQRAPIKTPSTPPDHLSDLAKDPLQSVQSELGTSRKGLTESEAHARLGTYGYNELPEEKTNALLKFLSYFWGPIPWMIEVAAALSAVVRHWEDFAIILTLLLVNAGVGFWEEFQAGNAVAALKAKLALHARVKRDGSWKTIPARELVPGDLMRVGIGEIVPADARLFEGDPIEVDQSALTGESLPVDRRSGDLVYSGSIVKQGEIDALVIATGGKTYFGKTAHLVETAHTVSHFQRAVMRIGDFLIAIALVLVAIILLVALFRGDPMLTALQFALILTIAAVPVAMPAVLSVTMAAGARKLAEKKAIVTHLAAMEELAGIDVLCSDKTGTLTQNKLTLGEPYETTGVTPSEIVLAAALASPADSQDPIDVAVRSGLKDPQEADQFRVLHFQPFDPVHKRTEALVAAPDNNQFRVSKGAVQVILGLAGNADQVRSGVEQAVEGFAARGFRALGVARTNQRGTWQFLGVLPLFDPPRPDSRETIATAEEMGVRVKMVTGDQLAIAKEMAHQLGLGSNIVDASVLMQSNDLQTRSRSEVIDKADGFAQVFPEHKYRLVRTLQQEGHIVGMTGDGVNDAPALKQADAGIAVSGASDAARAAADIALLMPGLSVIVDAIKESRKMFQRMNSYAIYRIAETIRILLFMTLAILVFNFYPVTAVMLVLLTLLNDGPILAIAEDRVRYRNAPESWDMPQVLGISSVLGLAGVIATFGLFYLAERTFHLDRNVIQTVMFLKLTVAGHLTIFVTRTRGPFWSIRPAPILFWSAVGTKALATLAAVYGFLMAPIGWRWALLIWGYALVWFVINDRIKLGAYRILDAHRGGLITHFWKTHTRQQPASQLVR